MRTRVGVLISGNGSTLQAILDCRELCDVGVVISSKVNAYGTIRAKRAGVPILVLPQELRGTTKRDEAEGWIIDQLVKYKIQKIILAGFMRIVSPTFIKKYSGDIFNIHPSLLPKYKGVDAFEAALKAEDKEGGVTVHHVAEEVDCGEFVLQRQFDIPRCRDSQLSHLWLHIQEQRVLKESLRKILWHQKPTSLF